MIVNVDLIFSPVNLQVTFKKPRLCTNLSYVSQMAEEILATQQYMFLTIMLN